MSSPDPNLPECPECDWHDAMEQAIAAGTTSVATPEMVAKFRKQHTFCARARREELKPVLESDTLRLLRERNRAIIHRPAWTRRDAG
ncbi:hypothetical protein [Kitasatospora sp. McL0602]|uniref:hypothetical protein n=1 Tax=Kitasatospora sp. McL0602 TaxID=3439530 RepID=UPI003F8BE024